ncbi:uncharacterized protein LOC118426467 [Branchiostoma floridae]|uniref:Uncharacterized protein LOC118426467 n=1 Tax=Branchiostoma floridae TaxID=7739 RepID=A0A9J7LZ97_BRAFL|nr:uncharacterized protein LOC118426467 [Branchiostoma floridae]
MTPVGNGWFCRSLSVLLFVCLVRVASEDLDEEDNPESLRRIRASIFFRPAGETNETERTDSEDRLKQAADIRGRASERKVLGVFAREYRCGEGETVPQLWICDGTEDCRDGRDEDECVDRCGSLGYPDIGCECDIGNCAAQRPSPLCRCPAGQCRARIPSKCDDAPIYPAPPFNPFLLASRHRAPTVECNTPMDLAFVIDGSASVGPLQFEKSKKFVRDMVDGFDIGSAQTRVGVVQFAWMVQAEFNLGDYLDGTDLRNAIARIRYMDGPGTEIGKALVFTKRRLFSELYGARPETQDVPRIVILITDGRSSPESQISVWSAAHELHTAGVVVYAVGVGEAVDEAELETAASDSSKVYHVTDFDSLMMLSLQDSIQQSVCLGGANVTVTCTSYHMQVDLSRVQLPQLEARRMRLIDPSCRATSNTTHVTLWTYLDGCGTSRTETDDSIVYINTIVEDLDLVQAPTGGNPAQQCGLQVKFTCRMARTGTVATTGAFNAITEPERFYSTGHGHFHLTMTFYADLDYQVPAPEPLSVRVCDMVYVQIQLYSADPDLRVFALDCWATPTAADTAGPLLYDIIKNGCGVDPTFQPVTSDVPSAQRFGFQAFKFAGVSSGSVVLRCQVLVCVASDKDSRCAQGCDHVSRREARSDVSSQGIPLVHGPIELIKDD